MNKYPVWRTGVISTSILNQLAIINKLFPKVSFSIYKELYKDLPEDTIALKIIKVRKTNNLEREDFALKIGHHFTTVKQWEIEDVPPKPDSIRHICDTFNIPLNYFHNYYSIYFSNYVSNIRKWKNKNNYTYEDMCRLLNISHSGLGRLLNGKIKLSYDMYVKLKGIGIL